jgi:putative ABC transport system permease protein
LDPFGFQLRQHTEPRSLAVAFAAGVVLTFAVMYLAAWRVSRVNIVSATHGELHEQRLTWWAGAGLLSLGAAWLVWTGWSDTAATFEPRHSLVLPVTRTLALAGCFALGRWMLGVTRSGGHVLTAVFPCALAAVWLATLRALPTPRGSTTADATTTAVGGLVLLVCVTWAVARAGEPLLRLVDRALSRAARLRSIVRPAAGQLGWQRWRSGLTVTMFAMVIFIMAASLTLIDALLDAYAANEAPVAGFELRAEYRSAGNPPAASDALARSDAIATSAFDAVGSTSRLDVQVVQIGVQRASWRGASLVAADDGFLGAARVRMQRRVSGYADAAAIWKALREQPGTAVVSASLLTSVVGPDPGAVHLT